jgi:hypothetical protein
MTPVSPSILDFNDRGEITVVCQDQLIQAGTIWIPLGALDCKMTLFGKTSQDEARIK